MSKNGKLYRVRRKLQKLALKLTSYEFMAKIYYFITFKRKLNLKNPYYFNEKINWLKLNYYPENKKVVQATDKYGVREYIKEKGLEEILNELIGVWDSWDELNWEELPAQLALKCTHGAQYNVITDDKSKLNEKDVEKKMKKWLSEDFGKFNGEKHYSKVKPRIICEEYLSEHMIDYKFFCFNGSPKFLYVAEGFGQLENEKIEFFNLDGSKAPFKSPKYDTFDEEVEMPDNFEEMIEISKILAEDFPFVRVDLFTMDGKIYLSELTFTPTAGLMKIEPTEMYEVWGNYLNLSEIMGS